MGSAEDRSVVPERASEPAPVYRSIDVALLRAAAVPLTAARDWWPDLAAAETCRAWLVEVWARRDLVEAVRQASPSLADRVDAICAGCPVGARQIRRAAATLVRYVLRATGRPTPFGLFAGVAPVVFGQPASGRWGSGHRPVARVNTEWLADIIDGLEACPDLLVRLKVVFCDLAVRRGGRLELNRGTRRVTIQCTAAVDRVRVAAATPVRCDVLVDRLSEAFTADRSAVRGMIGELVQQGFLITELRAPFTVTDPLAHVVDRLCATGARDLPSIAPRLRELEAVQAAVDQHNHGARTRTEQARARAAVSQRMRRLSPAGRTALVVDLRLECDVQVPRHVADELARAADALLRLSCQPAADPAWREFHAAFCDRYGTGTLVPLGDVIDLDGGLGYPAGYPRTVLMPPPEPLSERDERLLALAWQVMADGSGEVTLTDERIRSLTGGRQIDERYIPPHVEMAGRIQATTTDALDCGDYTIVVFPARAGGTLTSRFTPLLSGSGLQDAYRALPVGTDGAVAAQLSFPPAYSHADNVCREPEYLPDVLGLGEHRAPEAHGRLSVDDLAITATRERLHLVSISRGCVVEPQVFHALALDKQAPALARFLAQLPRAFSAHWHAFDWGPHAAGLPYLPRVRYRRSILSLARWRLTNAELPSDKANLSRWRRALDMWWRRWGCPDVVDLRDADRTLRLTLDEPAHTALLRAHLDREGEAILTEAPTSADLGWLEGHAHEIAVPLVTTRARAPSPLRGALPRVTNRGHGQLPGSPQASWLSARIHTHPERQEEIVAQRLPALLNVFDDAPTWWFVRYRNGRETDHLRLRIATPSPERHAAAVSAVGSWAQLLRQDGIAGRLVLDAYYPEIGRYGHGPAIEAAEAVFVADSEAVAAAMRRPSADPVHAAALVVAGMLDIAVGMLGDESVALRWMADRPVPGSDGPDRAVADETIRLATHAQALPGWTGEVEEGWRARAAALTSYRALLPPSVDVDGVVESLMHMHHNRAIGIDPDNERACRRLARRLAQARLARRGELYR